MLVAILVDLAIARFSPDTQIPTTGLGRDMTRVAACGLLLLLLFIKFIAHVGDFGWGFFVDVILALVVTAGCWMIAQGKATPLTTSGARARQARRDLTSDAAARLASAACRASSPPT